MSVTSQVYFCSAPIRIDSYDTCQFACVYCFSRDRSRRASSSGVHSANAAALQQRFDRVNRGIIASALDEFLQKRVPIQLGGLQDPFTAREVDDRVTLAVLRVLEKERYPTLISTKGGLYIEPEYLDILKKMNLVFRLSASGIAERLRPLIDRKASPFEITLERIAKLSGSGIKVALRIQPVFPGFEDDALRMASAAAQAGAAQVTFEYLKLPNDSVRGALSDLQAEIGDVLGLMTEMGIKKTGPDWTLTTDAKRSFVRTARKHCHALGLRFGAGDTEFIPWSDGNGCCGSSELFLDANQFDTNFVGAIKSAVAQAPKTVEFKFFAECWVPQHTVGHYMDYRSRVPIEYRDGKSDWMQMLRRRWNGGRGPYSPGFFDGVEATNQKDEGGMTIYDASRLAAELA